MTAFCSSFLRLSYWYQKSFCVIFLPLPPPPVIPTPLLLMFGKVSNPHHPPTAIPPTHTHTYTHPIIPTPLPPDYSVLQSKQNIGILFLVGNLCKLGLISNFWQFPINCGKSRCSFHFVEMRSAFCLYFRTGWNFQ